MVVVAPKMYWEYRQYHLANSAGGRKAQLAVTGFNANNCAVVSENNYE